ncbi:MAG TPA: CvpA family protein [Bryobacteraceae bacterium]|nr:CvpA family protein [Bryobacteraceae bacterium]
MNWIDWLMLCFLFGSVVVGFTEGFVRSLIGFVALIAAFLCAAWFYGSAAEWFSAFVKSQPLANLLGFAAIFTLVSCGGALLGWLINRLLRVVGLGWLDRVAGGGFGLVRGVLTIGIVALLATSLFPSHVPKAVAQSQLAPYVWKTSDVLAELTPYPLRSGFEESYRELSEVIRSLESEVRTNKSRVKHLPLRRE